MASEEIEVSGESNVFGAPTTVGPWEMQTESTAAIVWRRETGETDLDPDDGEEKPLFEWVRVAIGPHGGSWRGKLHKGFADTTMQDRPVLTQFEQASRTDKGRDQVVDAAVAFMRERVTEDFQRPVGGLTDDEEEIIETWLAEEDAEDIAGWHRVDPPTAEPDSGDEVVLEWENDTSDIFVTVEFRERETDEGERRVSWWSIMRGTDARTNVEKIFIKTLATDLEDTLDSTGDYLRTHDPNVQLAQFNATIEGGIIKPLVNALRRFTGHATIEARADALAVRGSGFASTVDFRIGRGSMESYDVQQEGEIAVNTDEFWNEIQPFNFGDDIPIAANETEDGTIRFGVGPSSFRALHPIRVGVDTLPSVQPSDAHFEVSGLEFRDVIKASRAAPSDVVAFGVHQGVPLLVSEARPTFTEDQTAPFEDEEAHEALRARFDATEVSGERMVAIQNDSLQNLRRVIPRPSQTSVAFTFKDELPILAEYGVDGVDVDMRVAIDDAEKIEDFDLAIPVEEVTVPEEATGVEDEPEVEAALEEAVEESEEEAQRADIDRKTDSLSFPTVEAADRARTFLPGTAIADEDDADDRVLVYHPGRLGGSEEEHLEEMLFDAWEEHEESEAVAGGEASIPEELSVFELATDGATFVKWEVDDGTGVAAEKRNDIWIVWVNDEMNAKRRVGWAPSKAEAVDLAEEAVSGFLSARDARQFARQPSEFDLGQVRRDTNNDVKGGPLQSLAEHFHTLDDLKAATIEEISIIDGVGPTTRDALIEAYGLRRAGEGTIQFPITTEQSTSGLIYATPPESVVIAVAEEIDDEVEERLGPAAQFEEGEQVGIAVVTDEPALSDRELVRVDIAEGAAEEAIEEEDVDVPDEVEAPDTREETTHIVLKETDRCAGDHRYTEERDTLTEENLETAINRVVDEFGRAEDTIIAPCEMTRVAEVTVEIDRETGDQTIVNIDLTDKPPRGLELLDLQNVKFPAKIGNWVGKKGERDDSLTYRTSFVSDSGIARSGKVRIVINRDGSVGIVADGEAQRNVDALSDVSQREMFDTLEEARDKVVEILSEFEGREPQPPLPDEEPEEDVRTGPIFVDERSAGSGDWHYRTPMPVMGEVNKQIREAFEAEVGTADEYGLGSGEDARVGTITVTDDEDIEDREVVSIEIDVRPLVGDIKVGSEAGLAVYQLVGPTAPEDAEEEIFDVVGRKFGESDQWATGQTVGTYTLTKESPVSSRELLGMRLKPTGQLQEAEDRDEDVPPEEEAITQSILVSLIGGSKNYNVPGRLRTEIENAAFDAALETLGKPAQFDVNDTVGKITFTDDEVLDIDLSAGLQLLGEEAERETAGTLIVGAARLDVPEPPDGWASVHFINRNQPNESQTGDRVVYLSPDRRLTVRLDGTRVSNKWSMRVMKHPEPIPEDPTDAELLFGPGEEDSESDFRRLVSNAVVDASAQNILSDNFPTVEEAEAEFPDDDDFGRTVEGTFEEEVVEEGELEEEVVEEEPPTEPPEDGDEDEDDTIELPVMVEDDFTDGFLYTAPANTVSLETNQEIDADMTDALGDAEQFDAGMRVGSAIVSADPDPADRVLIRVEPSDQLVEEEEDVDGVAPPEPDEVSLTRAEFETALEEATLGVEVDLPREDYLNLKNYKMETVKGEGITFIGDPERITVLVRGDIGPEEMLLKGLENWQETANIGNVDASTVAGINQRREALNEQFGLDLPLLPVPASGGLDTDDLKRIIEDATQGIEATVEVNPDADSLRIEMERISGTDVAIRATFDIITGQASRPLGAVRDALDIWFEAVDPATIERQTINRRRDRLEREFDIDLPDVPRPGREAATDVERDELREKWETLMVDLEPVLIEEEKLGGRSDHPLPIEVDDEMAGFLDEQERTQVERGLQIHHTDDVHDDIHAVVATVLDSEPENFWDSSQESDLTGMDRFYEFTLTRSRPGEEWTVPRFAPSTLFELLEPFDGSRIKVVALGWPLA